MERSGTVTILFSDLVGSTEAMELLGDEEAVSATMTAIRTMRQVTADHRGEVVKTMGDGILAAFDSALDAVTSAVSIQQAVSEGQRELDVAAQMPLRIGIHAGEPIRAEGDYFGMPVAMASRICGVADAGQIVISDTVRGLVGRRGRFVLRDLGERAFGRARSRVRLWEVVWNAERASRQASAEAAEHERAAPVGSPETAVILFADIVDSVPQTERLGDAAFRERARALDSLLRDLVRQHRGMAIDGKLVGDGVLATFSSARGAIDCALECGQLGATVGLELHLGIHAGDVIRDGNNIYGGAVSIASRIADATQPGEILVSETIRGLGRTSAGVSFVDRGEFPLKGVDEPQRLYTVRADQAAHHAKDRRVTEPRRGYR